MCVCVCVGGGGGGGDRLPVATKAVEFPQALASGHKYE